MHADNDAYKAGDKESHFANYMKSNYPEIVDFIVTSSKEISFDKVLLDKLNVMDATAIVMCRDNNLSLRIFNLLKPDTLVTAMTDMSVGTSVSV